MDFAINTVKIKLSLILSLTSCSLLTGGCNNRSDLEWNPPSSRGSSSLHLINTTPYTPNYLNNYVPYYTYTPASPTPIWAEPDATWDDSWQPKRWFENALHADQDHFDPRLHDGTSPLRISTNEVSESMNHWKREADARGRIMEESLQNASRQGHQWGAAETIMNTEIEGRTLQAVHNLNHRYPHAVAFAARSFQEVLEMTESFRPIGPNGEDKKAAALRFLNVLGNDPIYNYLDSTSFHTQLKVTEFLSLAWIAINDEAIYPLNDEMTREDNKWRLIVALGTIQRAHNETPNGSIDFTSGTADRISCAKGTFQRLIDLLDNSHPDVKIKSANLSQGEIMELLTEVRVLHALPHLNEDKTLLFKTFNNYGPTRAKPNRAKWDASDWQTQDELDRALVIRAAYKTSLRNEIQSARLGVSNENIDQYLNDDLILNAIIETAEPTPA